MGQLNKKAAMHKTKQVKQLDFEIRTNSDETLDEVLATYPKSMHLEQMSPDQWWLNIETASGKDIVVWFTTPGRTHINVFAELEGRD